MYKDNDWIEIVFLFEGRPTEDTITNLLNVLATRSTHQNNDETLSTAFWDDTSDINQEETGVEEAADIVTDYQVSVVTISFDGFELQVGYEYNDNYLDSVPHLVLSEQIHPFTETNKTGIDAEIKRHRHLFADILADAGEIITPKWGFGRRGGVASDSKPATELLVKNRPPLYEYNLFNSEMVDSIGRKVIADSPAWYINELSSGGVFLVTREPPRSCSPQEDTCVVVARHLGLEMADFY
jgi:hypothetical protein